jgi:transcriptional regulator with XRE-family HTH domain
MPICSGKMLIMNVKAFFGENLKIYRKEKHLSQEQLSEKVDISIKHLSAIERGLTFVSAELLERLSASLEIPIYYLFVKNTEAFYNDTMLNIIDRTIEKHLIKAIEDIKADIHQSK